MENKTIEAVMYGGSKCIFVASKITAVAERGDVECGPGIKTFVWVEGGDVEFSILDEYQEFSAKLHEAIAKA